MAVGDPQSGVPTVLVIINQVLHAQIQEGLAVFEKDLGNEGYIAVESLVSSQARPDQVRDILRGQFDASNLKGAILIGNIKAPYAEIHTGDFSNPQAVKVWMALDAVDMYYMDLDGQWDVTTDPNLACSLEDKPSTVVEWNKYESCSTFKSEYIVYPQSRHMKWDYPGQVQNKAQFQAEIWVSRIMAHNLVIPGKNEAQIINDYFDLNHAYRTGIRYVSSKAYILNAGSDPNDYNDQGMNYTTIFDTVVKQGAVTKSTYVGYLNDPGGSRLLYLSAHSWPQGHTLSDTSLTVDELANTMKNSVLYLLNTCSACRWDQFVSTPSNPNYMCGVYVFDRSSGGGDYGLGAIGFTGVGGFNFLEYFTDYLRMNSRANYGEAYTYYFNQNLMRLFGASNYVYIGDPTLAPNPFAQTPPSLDIWVDQVSGLSVGINGGTLPGTPGTTVTRIKWNWGDGTIEDHYFPATHLYSSSGNYTITVTSLQSDGSSTRKSLTVTVGQTPLTTPRPPETVTVAQRPPEAIQTDSTLIAIAIVTAGAVIGVAIALRRRASRRPSSAAEIVSG